MTHGHAAPACAANAITLRQFSDPRANARRKNGSSIKFASPGSRSYASLILCRNRARMMHPPRQIIAIRPKSSFQL
jgi:hypothetical protein